MIYCLINISSENGDLSFDLEPMLDLAKSLKGVPNHV
jgi:hypothetical protein